MMPIWMSFSSGVISPLPMAFPFGALFGVTLVALLVISAVALVCERERKTVRPVRVRRGHAWRYVSIGHTVHVGHRGLR